MSNIYLKQMQQLGLNPKQYAELVDLPYEVVKDFIYEKEGSYSMDIKNVLRKNIFNKHQEIENNYEDARLKATEIKHRDNTDKRSWYENEYNVELLLNTLHLKTRAEFERTYELWINGKPASKWIGYCMMSKINYDNHEVSRNIQDQYIEQLYDILVNGNKDKYKRLTPIKASIEKSKRPPKKIGEYKNLYFKWFTDFDVKAFMKRHNLNNNDLAKALGLGIVTISCLANKKNYTKRTLQKLYLYVDEVEGIESNKEPIESQKQDLDEIINYPEKDEEIEILDTIDVGLEESRDEKIDNSQAKIDIEAQDTEEIDNNILRKILINRLTDEEKELIKIFGGKI